MVIQQCKQAASSDKKKAFVKWVLRIIFSLLQAKKTWNLHGQINKIIKEKQFKHRSTSLMSLALIFMSCYLVCILVIESEKGLLVWVWVVNVKAMMWGYG